MAMQIRHEDHAALFLQTSKQEQKCGNPQRPEFGKQAPMIALRAGCDPEAEKVMPGAAPGLLSPLPAGPVVTRAVCGEGSLLEPTSKCFRARRSTALHTYR